jgi:hypothetical protein
MYGISGLNNSPAFASSKNMSFDEAMYADVMRKASTPNFGITGLNVNSGMTTDTFGNPVEQKKEGSPWGWILGIGTAALAVGAFIATKGKVKPAFTKEFGKEFLKNLNPLKWNLGDKFANLGEMAKGVKERISNFITNAKNSGPLKEVFPVKAEGITPIASKKMTDAAKVIEIK